MPLVRSGSKKAVSENIRREISAGRPHRQSVAIALSVARKYKKAAGGEVDSGFDLGSIPPVTKEEMEKLMQFGSQEEGGGDRVRVAGPIDAIGKVLSRARAPRAIEGLEEKLIDAEQRLGRSTGSLRNYNETRGEIDSIKRNLKKLKEPPEAAVAADDLMPEYPVLGRSRIQNESTKFLGAAGKEGFEGALSRRHAPGSPEEITATKEAFENTLRKLSASEAAKKWGSADAAEAGGLPRSAIPIRPPSDRPSEAGVDQALRNYWEQRPQQKPEQFVPERTFDSVNALRGQNPYAKSGPFTPGQVSPPGSILPSEKSFSPDIVDRTTKRYSKSNPEFEQILNRKDEALYPPKPLFDREVNPVIQGGGKRPHDEAEFGNPALGFKTPPEGILHQPQRTFSERPIWNPQGGPHETGSYSSENVTRPRLDSRDFTPENTAAQLQIFKAGERRHQRELIKRMKDDYPEFADKIGKNRELRDLILKEEQKAALEKAGKSKTAGSPTKIAEEIVAGIAGPKAEGETVRLWYGAGNKGEPIAGSVFTKKKSEAERYAGSSDGLYYVDVLATSNMAKTGKGKLPKSLVGATKKFGEGFARGGGLTGSVSKIERAIRTAKKYASGGPLDSIPGVGDVNSHAESKGGLFNSAIPGRTDKLPVAVRPGSYIVPADILSSTKLGEGNTIAGAKTMDGMLEPHRRGLGAMGKHAQRSIKARFKSRSVKPRGLAYGGGTEKIPIIVAGGEYHIEPEEVQSIGGGDLDRGHNTLDKFVKKVRRDNIKTLRSLPGPKRN